MAEPIRPLSYAEVLNLYRGLADHPAVRGVDLPTFSQKLNTLTGGNAFAAGLNDSKLKRASVGFDELLRKTGVPQAAGNLFAGLARTITPTFEEQARSIGEGLPRTVAEVGSVASALAFPPVTVPLAAAGTLSAFSRAYTETDSPLAGTISAAANWALPFAGRAGARYVTGGLSKAVFNATDSNVAARAVDYVGEAIGASAAMEAANAATHGVTGQLSEYNPFSPENLFQQIAGQIAFAPLGAYQVLRGPQAGRFQSVGQQLAARDFAKAQLEAAKVDLQKEKSVNQREAQAPEVFFKPSTATFDAAKAFARRLPANQEPFFVEAAPGTIKAVQKAFKKLPEGPEEIVEGAYKTVDKRAPRPWEDVRDPVVSARRQTLLGEPIVPPEKKVAVPEQVPLLEGAQQPFFVPVGEDLVRQLVTGGLRSTGGMLEATGQPAKPTAIEVPFKRRELLETAQRLLSAAETRKSLAKFRETAKVANSIAIANGEPPKVTDAVINDKLEELTTTLPEHEAVARLSQSTENKLNEEAGKLSLRVRREEQANAEIAALPEPFKEFLGEGIKAASDVIAADRYADVISAKFSKAALNWLKKNSAKVAAAQTPEARAALVNELKNSLLRHAENAVIEHRKQKEGGGWVRTETVEQAPETTAGEVELPNLAPPDEVSVFGKEAVDGEESSFVNRAKQTLEDLLEVRPVTAEELADLKLNVDLAKLNAVIKGIALDAVFGDLGSQAKKGFAFRITEETKKAFPKTSDKGIQDWVQRNVPAIREVLERRLMEGGVDVSATGTLSKKELFNFFKDFSLKETAPRGSLPASTERFFLRYFLSSGHSPQEASVRANVAMRVAAQFKQVDETYIAELVDKTGRLRGVALTEDANKRLGVVGIELIEKITSKKEINAFVKTFVLGHEVFHRLWNVATDVLSPTATAKGYRLLTQLAKHVDETPVEERKAILSALFRVVVPPSHLKDAEVVSFLDEIMQSSAESTNEFIATYAGFLSLGAASGSGVKTARWTDFKNEILYSDKFYTDFANGFYTDLREVVGAIKDLAILGGAEKTRAAAVVDSMHQSFTELARTKEQVDGAVNALRFMQLHMPEHFGRTLERSSHPPLVADPEVNIAALTSFLWPGQEKVQFLRKAGVLRGVRNKLAEGKLEKYTGPHPNFFERNVMIPAHLKELYPVLNDVENLIYGYSTKTRNTINQMMLPFGYLDKKGALKFDKHSPLITVQRSKNLQEAVNQIVLEQNEQKRRLTHEEANSLPAMTALSEEQRSLVRQFVEQAHQSVAMAADLAENFKKNTLAGVASLVFIGRVPDMKAKAAIALGNQLVGGTFKLGSQDPLVQAQGKAEIDSVAAAVGPVAFTRAQQRVQALLPKFAKIKERLDEQRAYRMPEIRLGKYYIRFMRDGKGHFVGVEDATAAEKYTKKLENDPTVAPDSIKVFSKRDKNKDVNTLYGDVVNVWADIERAAYEEKLNEIRETIPDPGVVDLIQASYTPGEAVFSEVAARGFGKHFLPHSIIPGREEINTAQGIVAYIEGMAIGMAKAVTKRQASLLLADPEMKQNPALRDISKQHILTVVDPPTSEWKHVKSLGFHYFLGGNISSPVVEAFQALTMLAPELTRQGAGIFESYKIVGDAELAVGKLHFGLDMGLPKEWRAAEALKRAQDEGLIGLGIFQELEGLETDTALINLRRASEGADPLTAGEIVSKPLYWYLQGTRMLYRGATSHNDRVGFLAGFIQEMKRGGTWEDAYNHGIRLSRNAMLSGGVAARPIGLFAKSGKLYGAMGAMYTLRHYTFGALSNWYRLGKEAIGSSGLSDVEKSSARKALGQMVTTQFLMSGAMGLPMVSTVVTLLEQVFPDLQLRAEIQKTISGLFEDDEEMGQFVSDMALRGVLSTGPIDVSSRFGLGDLFGISPNKGVNWGTLFGAPGSVLERWVEGASQASTGNVVDAARQFLPNSLANLVKMHNDDYKIRDKTGGLIYDPTETEVLFSLAGFKPKRISYYREKQALTDRADEIARRQLKDFHSSLAPALLRGETLEVREALISRAHEDDMYDIRDGLRAVVEAAQRRLVPQDVTRTGSRGSIREREALSQAIPGVASRPSEVQLLVQRKQMEAAVGLPGTGRLSQTELKRAQAVDYLMQLNPTWTRQHALIVVEQMAGRR